MVVLVILPGYVVGIRGIVLTYKILVSDFFSSFVQTALDFYTRVPDIVWHI